MAMTSSWVREAAGVVVDGERHPNPRGEGSGDAMLLDDGIELCDYYEGFEAAGRDALLHGVYSLDDLRCVVISISIDVSLSVC